MSSTRASMAGSLRPVSRFQQRGEKRSTGAGGSLRPRLRRYLDRGAGRRLCVLEQLQGDPAMELALFGPTPCAAVSWHSGNGTKPTSSEFCNRLTEIEMVGAHDEIDRVAMRATAEAVKKSLILDHVERGRPLGVERAKADEFGAAPHQLEAALADQRRQHDATAQLVENRRRVVGHAAAELRPLHRSAAAACV